MALVDQILSVSFNQGLETKVDLKQGANGRMLSLNNATFIGVTSFQKRYGYNSLSTNILSGGSITNGNSSGVFNQEILMTFDGEYAYTYSPTKQANVNSGLKIATGLSSLNVSGEVATYFWPTETNNGDGIKFVAYPTSPTVAINYQLQFAYLDAANNDSLFSPTILTSTSSSQIFSLDSKAFSTYFVLAINQNTNIQLVTLPQIPGSTYTTISNVSNGSIPPTLVTTATNLYMLVYNGTNFIVYEYDTSMTLINTYTLSLAVSGDVFYTYIVYDSINNEFIVGASYTGGITVNRYSSVFTLLSTIATVSDASITNSDGQTSRLTFATDGINLGLYYESFNTTTGQDNPNYLSFIPYLNYRTSVTNLPTLTLGAFNRLYSEAFYLSGRFYIALIYSGPNSISSAQVIGTQTGMFLLSTDITNNYTVSARIAIDNSYANTNAVVSLYGNVLLGSSFANLVSWSLNNTIPIFNTIQETAVTVGTSQTGVLLPVFTTDEIKITFDSKLRNISLGKNLNISGACSNLYDGLGIAEQGYNSFPVISSSAIQTPGSTNSYGYSAVYIWYDFQGNLHRSATAIPTIIQTGAAIDPSDTVTLVISGLGLSEFYKMPNVQIQIYRTTNNGAIYYLIGTVNNNDIGYVFFTDTFTDALIDGNTQLYTTGNEVDNTSPPAYSCLTEFKNRQIIVDDEDPFQWWYSKQVIEGFPVEFSDLFTQNIDQKGGPITGLSTMDDKLIFFKTSNIWYVTGDGPAPDGSANDFSYPQIISSDTGCTNQDSIILTPVGLMFQSPKGIYLLGRDLSLNYIGSPVEAFNSDLVTSVQMIAYTNQVRFTLNTGVCLVYDYYVKQWSVFTNIAAVDSTIYNQNFTYLTASGVSNYETVGSYLDPGNVVIPMSFTTGWMKLSDLQGFERLKKLLILGLSSSASTINTSFNYDYSSINNQPMTPVSVTSDITRMQYRLFPPRQQGEAFQLVFSETPAAMSAGVTTLSNIALEIGIKKGPFKLPASNSYG